MAMTAEQKKQKTFHRKLSKLHTELSVARACFPDDVTHIEIQIHHLKMKYLGEDYLERAEAEKEQMRLNRRK